MMGEGSSGRWANWFCEAAAAAAATKAVADAATACATTPTSTQRDAAQGNQIARECLVDLQC